MAAALPRRAFLGAELGADREAFAREGLRIAGALPGGMAERAGLRGGDLLVQLAGGPVGDRCALAAALRRAGAASTATLAYLRGVKRIERTVDVDPHPREPGVDYGALAGAGGVRLRRLAIATSAPRAVVLVVPGVACESIEVATDPDAPLAGLVAGWTAARIDTIRVDKRGVGDSEGGPCTATDFATEAADVAVAFEDAAAVAARRGVPLVLFGHSVGALVAARLATDHRVAGLIVYGAFATRWLDCLVDSTRRQLALRGTPPAEIERTVGDLEERARTGGLNGRSAAYHAQLHELDAPAVWRRVEAPVLVLRGEHDWVVAAHDQARIPTLVRGPADLVDLPGLDHMFGHHADHAASLRDYGVGTFDPAIVDTTLRWLRRSVAP